jgi:deoxyribose-phosphate aldolase
MTDMPDLQATARIALACLDLTSLGDADTEADVERLCARAQGRFGMSAAVCVWPRFAARARRALPREVAVAAVANFPDGGSDVARAVRDTDAIVAAGAQEVDVVLPYRDLAAAPALLASVRRACEGLTLKVILETGEIAAPAASAASGAIAALEGDAAIRRACRIALDAGADFLKTSTGKVRVNATPAAARLLLEAIAADARARDRWVGFKAAGGVRTLADAATYIALARDRLGAEALTPRRFRIGASALLDDIEAVLGGAAPAAPARGS